MIKPFSDSDPPTEVLRLPTPSIEQVDAHPDSAFIWSVILATREACEAKARVRSYQYRSE